MTECMGVDGESRRGKEGKKSGRGENERGERETHGLAAGDWEECGG